MEQGMQFPAKVLHELRNIVGSDHVETAAEECRYFAGDIFSQDIPAGVVVAPNNVDQLAAVVQQATAHGLAVVPRGGGLSYTGGYVPVEPNSVLIDTQRMNRVLELNREDMYVTVECGISWENLYLALNETGLRTPYWGTLSGRFSTVGGSVSQNSIFFGSASHGTVADSLIGMKVVLADGSVLQTGSAVQVQAAPFFRHFGPDLTGMFIGDCGAFGLKAEVTLRLIPQPEAHAFGSFAFERYEDMLPAMSAVSRSNLVSECFGFDPYLQSQRMKRDSLASDAKKFVGVLKSSGGVGKAIRDGARMAVAGRSFMDDVQWSFHVMIEDDSEDSAGNRLDQVREIIGKHDGRELSDSIPRVVRANPFGPVNNMVGPEGERWAPVHGLLPHSRAVEGMRKIESLFESHHDEMLRYGVEKGYLLATVSTNAYVIEPVFFWPEELMEVQRRGVEAAHLKRLKSFPANPQGTELVTRIRGEIAELFEAMGAVHLQIGKTYRYRQGLSATSFALVQSFKQAVDPHNRMNPECLGLRRDSSKPS